MKQTVMGDAVKELAEEKQEEDENGNGQNEKDHRSAATPVSPDGEKDSLHQSTTVFIFWAYVAAFATLFTLSVVLVSSLIPFDEETEFFSMPSDVRQHFTEGKLLKIEVGKDRLPLKVFVREEGPLANSETVLLCHGLGASSFMYRSVISSLASRGLHVIALDFPGAGLSEKPAVKQGGLVMKLKEIYKEIVEKGLLWRFEQMFETGAFPEVTPTYKEVGVSYDANDLRESIAQVLSLLAPSPVHIVLHDTSVEAGLMWAIENPASVRSLTLIDTYPGAPSFPVGILGIPGVGFMILRSSILLQVLLRFCCVKHITQVEAHSHAFLLRIKGGQGAALQTWKMINGTFNFVSTIEKLGDLPVHLAWSNSSGDRWQELGDWLVSRVSGASKASHSGGRWPQEDKAAEVTEELHRFITSLPSTPHSAVDESAPQNTQEMLNVDNDFMGNYGQNFHTCEHGNHNHDHAHHHHETHNEGHIHDHGLGYMDHMGHGGWVI